jgi:hypothetical protein
MTALGGDALTTLTRAAATGDRAAVTDAQAKLIEALGGQAEVTS